MDWVETTIDTGLTTEQEFALIKRYSPVIYLNSREVYYPSSIDWLLSKSTLVDYNSDNIFKDSPTNEELYNISKKNNFAEKTDGTLTLSWSSEIYTGQRPIKDVPIYAYVQKREDKFYITYVFVFPFNGSYEILGIRSVGDHPGDLEHLTVELDADKNLLRVLFGAHGVLDANWVDVDEVEFEDGKPVAYVALNGHGLYSKAGVAFRLYGLGNDYMDKGTKWVPETEQIFKWNDPRFDPKTMGWTMFNGRFGGTKERGSSEGITSLYNKNWYKGVDLLDAGIFDPPRIYSSSYINFLVTLKNIIFYICLYLLILFILVIVKKFLLKSDKNTFFQHGLALFITFLIVILITNILNEAILKAAPK
jgi:hypothetical protein